MSMNVEYIVLCSNSECQNVLTLLVQRQKAIKTTSNLEVGLAKQLMDDNG